MLSKADHEAVAAAVARAEARTSGEVLCVLAKRVSNYRETPIAWGAGLALLLPPAALDLGLRSLLFATGWDSGGVDSNAASAILRVYPVAQAVIFVVVALAITLIRPLKLVLTPKALKHRRVRQMAMQQLMATRLVSSTMGAAVVIFASTEDRMVAVVADEAIHAKVGTQAWDKAVATVLGGIKSGDPAAGFVGAVDLCGDLLAEHFPATGGGQHPLSDDLLEV